MRNRSHKWFLLPSRVLLRSRLITPEIIQSLLPWVNSPMENFRVTGTAFLAQVRHRALKSSFTFRPWSVCLSFGSWTVQFIGVIVILDSRIGPPLYGNLTRNFILPFGVVLSLIFVFLSLPILAAQPQGLAERDTDRVWIPGPLPPSPSADINQQLLILV